MPQPQGTGTRTQHIQPNVDDQNDRDTPPLPVLSNGDVLPSAFFDSILINVGYENYNDGVIFA